MVKRGFFIEMMLINKNNCGYYGPVTDAAFFLIENGMDDLVYENDAIYGNFQK